jgi:hypothetical protein
VSPTAGAAAGAAGGVVAVTAALLGAVWVAGWALLLGDDAVSPGRSDPLWRATVTGRARRALSPEGAGQSGVTLRELVRDLLDLVEDDADEAAR